MTNTDTPPEFTLESARESIARWTQKYLDEKNAKDTALEKLGQAYSKQTKHFYELERLRAENTRLRRALVLVAMVDDNDA